MYLIHIRHVKFYIKNDYDSEENSRIKEEEEEAIDIKTL